MNKNNQLRAIHELVTLDAWVEQVENSSRYNLHVDVSFSQARMGGEEESQVRFRVMVMGCDVVAVVPNEQSLSVVKNSVARSKPSKIKVSQTSEIEKSSGYSIKAALGLKKSEASIGGKHSNSKNEAFKTQRDESVDAIQIRNSKSSDGYYSWQLQSTDRGPLIGSAWDAQNSPRLKIEDRRSFEQIARDNTNRISPVVSVEIRCKREDIIISEIQHKDDTKQTMLQKRKNHSANLAAAEGVIKNIMLEEGLPVANISEIFSELNIADQIVELS